jgi:uncharacterized delta-60 repeat protein
MKKSLFNLLCISLYLLIPLFSYSQAGSLDLTFPELNITPVGSIKSFAEQSDGKIIIAGNFTSINGISIPKIARLNIDGSLDMSFITNIGTGISGNSQLNKVVIQSDNKIILGGKFPTFNGVLKNSIARLNSDGTIDNTFNTGSGFTVYSPVSFTFEPGQIRDIKLKTNGQIIVSGGWTRLNNIPINSGLIQFNSNGSLDASYNIDTTIYGRIITFDIQNDGKTVIFMDKSTQYGLISHSRYSLRRFNTNGSIDNTFSLSNTILSEENIGGNMNNFAGEYLRIYEIKCLNSGKILIGGTFLNTFGVNNKNICRLNANGTVDNTFQGNVNSPHTEISAIEEQTDGKIIIGGKFSLYNNISTNNIVRVNSNGIFDSSFMTGLGYTGQISPGPWGIIYNIKKTLNNKILVIGNYQFYNNIGRNSISRLNLNCNLSPTFDLIVKDSSDDTGIEPNTVTPYMWMSDNIWIRNYNDNGLEHQNPVYSATGNANFIRVRVINNSCITSLGNEQLKLYWAKASTALSYPNPWMGGITYPPTGANMGSPIGTLNIPVLQPGEETILTFPWIVPNPNDYGTDGDQWHFCLLARITATNDPMTSTETTDLNANVRNSNNIAWKNVTVVDILPRNGENPGGVIAVGNPFDHPKTFFLEMEIADLETGKPIYEEAEIGIKMDEILYNAWIRGGGEAQKLEPTHDETRKIVRGNNVILDNLSFDANEIGTLRLDFNFLTRELTNKTNYAYHVIQKDSENGEIIGGETFIINKNQRELFEANAGNNLEVDLNQSITISAEDINEPAIYNWYDSEGNLIYEGKDLQISNAISEKYKLEVISTVDGFKDYTEIEVKLKPSTLETISPNPAQNNVTIGYRLNSVSSAYLMILGYYESNGTSNNYILDVNSNEIDINISNYPSGFYTVALVIDGNIIDAKILIKQ